MRSAAILLLLLLTGNVRAGDAVLGVLEEGCEDGVDASVAVRPLFVRDGKEWRLSEDPVATAWTVTLDGRSIGRLRTLDADGGETLPLAPDQRVPEIRNTSGSFRGWCGVPARRPLAVSSRSEVRDPDRWRPFTPPQDTCSRLFHVFRSEAGDASCGDGQGNVMDVPYHAEDLRVASAWRDRAGRELLAIVLPYEQRCDGPWEGPWKARWFLVVEDGVRYLGSNLELVDAGDYDGDGTSEILFRYSAYGEDGYTLFHDGLEKRTDRHRRY